MRGFAMAPAVLFFFVAIVSPALAQAPVGGGEQRSAGACCKRYRDQGAADPGTDRQRVVLRPRARRAGGHRLPRRHRLDRGAARMGRLARRPHRGRHRGGQPHRGQPRYQLGSHPGMGRSREPQPEGPARGSDRGDRDRHPAPRLAARPGRGVADPLGAGATDRVAADADRWWRARRAIPVLIIGLYLVLQISGLTSLALTVLGGTGIAGIIIGFAFRDIAENFLASLLLSMRNPFHSGDLVRIGDNEGIVTNLNTRSTVLLTLDGNHVQIPNAAVFKSVIVNFSSNPSRRAEFLVGIGYDDRTSAAQSVIEDVLSAHPAVRNDPAPFVVVDELAASTVNLRIFFWFDSSTYSPIKLRSALMRQTKQALLANGISMPDEAREIIFPQGLPIYRGDAAEGQGIPAGRGKRPRRPSRRVRRDQRRGRPRQRGRRGASRGGERANGGGTGEPAQVAVMARRRRPGTGWPA